MDGKFKVKLKMPVRSLKKLKMELKRLGTKVIVDAIIMTLLGTLPVLQNPGIPGQAMPIPVIPGGEMDKPFPPMKKVSHDDIRKMVAFGAKIYAGETGEGQKNGPEK